MAYDNFLVSSRPAGSCPDRAIIPQGFAGTGKTLRDGVATGGQEGSSFSCPSSGRGVAGARRSDAPATQDQEHREEEGSRGGRGCGCSSWTGFTSIARAGAPGGRSILGGFVVRSGPHELDGRLESPLGGAHRDQ